MHGAIERIDAMVRTGGDADFQRHLPDREQRVAHGRVAFFDQRFPSTPERTPGCLPWRCC